MSILLNEPEKAVMAAALVDAEGVRISAPTLVELTSVAGRRGLLDEADALLEEAGSPVVPFDLAQAAIARDALRRFGTGRHRLNLGDTFAYALSKHTGEPLLFKGDDFARTDVLSALS
jgi:ribonuclease VapC